MNKINKMRNEAVKVMTKDYAHFRDSGACSVFTKLNKGDLI